MSYSQLTTKDQKIVKIIRSCLNLKQLFMIDSWLFKIGIYVNKNTEIGKEYWKKYDELGAKNARSKELCGL